MTESDKTGKRRATTRRPDLDTVYTIKSDGSRNMIHPADVKGRWQLRKEIIWAILVVIYIGIPWVRIGGRPAMLIDLPARHAFLFGNTFTNQDFYLVFFIISGIGFSLFVATALWGRVWCGYACPQTVFLEGWFRKIERLIEGRGEARIRRNQGPMTFDKFWRKTLKHLIFLCFSFWIAHTFLSYFIPVQKILTVIMSSPAAHPTAFFWSMFWTAALYFDYAWFREQLCLIICPYGRLQSTLIDQDTVVIGYDENRGEPRTKQAAEGGDCIDCFRCVAVCPTGIDIRNGQQMECIGCANCIDACDDIMAKVGKPGGLVRYDTQRSFSGEARRRLFRPKVIAYLVLFVIGGIVFSAAAGRRTPVEVQLLRQKGMPFVLEEDKIRNLYNLHIQNKTGEDRVYFIEPRPGKEAEPFDPEYVTPIKRLEIDSFDDKSIPVFVFVERKKYSDYFPLGIAVTDSATGYEKLMKLKFRGP